MKGELAAIAGWIGTIVVVAMFAVPSRADTSPGGNTTTQNGTPTTAVAPAADYSTLLTNDWYGTRKKLAGAGVSIGASLSVEGFYNFQGGVDTGAVGSTTFDLNVTLDLQILADIPNAKIYGDLEDHAFRNPTTALVGDLQVFGNYNSPPFLQVFELWYQQTFFDGTFRVKVGKVDANTEFCVIDNGLQFLNSSAQLSPTIFTMPTYPAPMPGINLFLTPKGALFASFGAYYANKSDRFADIIDDPAIIQPAQWGAFLIGEVGLKWNALGALKYQGNLKVGAWGHTGEFREFDGSMQGGTGGGYALFDQTLYQPAGESPAGRGVRMFLVAGATQANVNAIDDHVGGGLTLTGPTQSRASDMLGVGFEYARISGLSGLPYPFELSIESFYQIQVTPWMQVQPDLQYIVHPGGKYDDALVATVRATIQF